MAHGCAVASVARYDKGAMLLRLLSRPLPLLLLFVVLGTFLIQPGELGTSDTTHRLQVAHSFWTGQPQIFPSEFPESGVHGRNGHLYAMWGIGQSLLLLPFDLLGSALAHLPLWRDYVDSQTDPAIRSIVVSFCGNVLVNTLTALVAYRLLGLLGFGMAQAVAGVLGLLLATTHLHYAQNMTENNYILLLTLCGFAGHYRWLLLGERRPLLLGALALGLNLLTRVTTVLDIGACTLFLLLTAWFSADNRLTAARVKTWALTTLPVYAGFLFLDRLYQFARFGSWKTTYLSEFAREQRRLDPTLPVTFPFNGTAFHSGLHSGVWGPLFSPEKSIFLFDPMLPVTLLLVAVLWRRLPAQLRALQVSAVVLIAIYIAFYAKFIWWPGDFAWGDRYVSSAVELASMLALPLLVRYRAVLGRPLVRGVAAVTAASLAIQCASLAFWLPLEIYQGQDFNRHVFVIGLRFKNIVAFALGKRAAWGLNTPSMFEDPWDAAHLTAWNFLPSLLRHIGVAPLGAVHVLYGVWSVAGVLLAWVAVRLGKAVRGAANASPARPSVI